MLRRTFPVLMLGGDSLKNFGFGKGWRDLWFKPQTRDEKIKEYVPEVIEESLQEQRAVLDERTSRDVVVELGHKVLREIENKAPTPSIAPSFNAITKEFGATDLIGQRALSYLLYPTSVKEHGRNAATPHELVENFADNLKAFIDYVEANGSASLDKLNERAKATAGTPALEGTPSPAAITAGEVTKEDAEVPNEAAPAASPESEAAPSATPAATPAAASATVEETPDVTLYVKLLAGMSLANVRCNELHAALRCCDNGIDHVIDPQRLGGLLGMKAGILNRMRRFEEAAEVAQKAIAVSNNSQGYLQGAAALKMLKREAEVVALLEKGKEQLGENPLIEAELNSAKKKFKPALTE